MAVVTIVLDTSVPQDKEALTQLFGPDFAKVASSSKEEVKVVQHTPPAKDPEKVAAPPKTKAAPKPPPRAEAWEDLISGGADLREQAVQKATELVTSGKSSAVREALAGLDAKRVGDLADDQLEAFLAALA